MVSKSRSRSGTRKVSKAPSRIVTEPSEEYSLISEGRRDTLQTTINKTGYLGDLSSAAGVPKINKTSKDINYKIIENNMKQKNVPHKIVNSEATTDRNSNIPSNEPNNFIDRRYQSCCIDDTNNGTLLFNNTETVMLPTIKQGNQSLKLGAIKNYPLFEISSDDETFDISDVKRYSTRSRSKNLKKSCLKDESVKIENDNCEMSIVMEKEDKNSNELTDEGHTTPSNPQTTTLEFYSEFKNEYEHLLDGSKILAEVSSSDVDKINIQPPSDKDKFKKIKKLEKKQPSPIPKERGTEISEIDSYTFKKPFSVGKKNTSAKYNRLTLAQQLEKTFIENDVPLNDSKLQFFVDKFNHTYRNSLEETLPNFDIKCLANSTCRDESHEKTLYTDTKSQKLSTPYLSRNFVKNLGFNSIASETDKNETILKMEQFPIVNDCSTEMVRQCSNQKITNVISTPTTISDIGIKKSETVNDNNIITTTNTRDIYSIDNDDSSENNTTKFNITNETFIDSTKKLNESKNVTKNTIDKSDIPLETTQQIEKKPFINPSIIDDFRDEMIQSVNDVCEFLSQKVKNDTAVNLVEERFMENARFLYKFFFHSCREGN